MVRAAADGLVGGGRRGTVQPRLLGTLQAAALKHDAAGAHPHRREAAGAAALLLQALGTVAQAQQLTL